MLIGCVRIKKFPDIDVKVRSVTHGGAMEDLRDVAVFSEHYDSQHPCKNPLPNDM